MKKLLAGDVGATKTMLGIYAAGKGPQEPLAEATFASSHYPSLSALVSTFLTQTKQAVECACFGVAGLVIDGRIVVSNLAWRLDQQVLKKELKLRSIFLINDVEATAQGVPLLKPAELHCLNKGEEIKGGTKAVIAPGTGLGEAFLTWDGSRYRAHASEGGQADFAPTNALEDDLLQHLRNKRGHVSYERVCSGMAIPHLYYYLKENGYAEEPVGLAQQLTEAGDQTAFIIEAAVEHKAQLCTGALDLFCSILGAEAGNLAFKVLATGGVYLGGGIPPRILPVLKQKGFMQAFLNKGRLSDVLKNISVYVILNPTIALIGAAYYGLELCMSDT